MEKEVIDNLVSSTESALEAILSTNKAQMLTKGVIFDPTPKALLEKACQAFRLLSNEASNDSNLENIKILHKFLSTQQYIETPTETIKALKDATPLEISTFVFPIMAAAVLGSAAFIAYENREEIKDYAINSYEKGASQIFNDFCSGAYSKFNSAQEYVCSTLTGVDNDAGAAE